MAEKRSGSPRRRSSGSAARDKQGEHLEGKGWKTALIDGATFATKPVQYTEVDGLAMFEGDIVLGTVEEVEQRTEMLRQVGAGTLQAGVMITGANRRWPNCKVPYDIDSAMPDQARVTDAIAHWEANTRFRFVLRSAANAAQFPDWVTFRSGSGCSSTVGKAGGQQFVNLGSGCSKGNAIHEIGHTIGLWHEQSREDRDSFVTIHWDKIQAGMEHNSTSTSPTAMTSAPTTTGRSCTTRGTRSPRTAATRSPRSTRMRRSDSATRSAPVISPRRTRSARPSRSRRRSRTSRRTCAWTRSRSSRATRSRSRPRTSGSTPSRSRPRTSASTPSRSGSSTRSRSRCRTRSRKARSTRSTRVARGSSSRRDRPGRAGRQPAGGAAGRPARRWGRRARAVRRGHRASGARAHGRRRAG